MSSQFALYAAAAAVMSTAGITWAARLIPRPTPPATAAAVFTVPEQGVRYLRCDTPHCAHMTHPHRPQAGGTYVCSNCGDVKGETA